MDFERVFQFKITLRGVEPQIWRRIEVPENYTFWEFHVAIQDAMGWFNMHFFKFIMKHPRHGWKTTIEILTMNHLFERKPSKKFLFNVRKERLKEWFNSENRRAVYHYDFVENWIHDVELEDILPRERGKKYPICISGERACPPEGCGGVKGYYKVLEILRNPNHPEFKETLEWLELDYGDYDPEKFDPQEVIFNDPEEEWESLKVFVPEILY